MRALLIALAISVLGSSLVWSQPPGEDKRLPEISAPKISVGDEVGQPVKLPTAHELELLKKDITVILQTTKKIADTQEQEGSLLLKVRDTFLTNALWEFFGFKNTEKTVAGYAISILGILGLVLKAVWFVAKSGKPEPVWARGLTYTYLVLVVAVFSALVFSGGVVSEVSASNSAAQPLLEAANRLDRTVDSRLQALDKKIEGLNPRPYSEGSALDPMTTESLKFIQQDLKEIHSFADTAAKKAAEAADRSTGWVWHLVIAGLLVLVLLIQIEISRRV